VYESVMKTPYRFDNLSTSGLIRRSSGKASPLMILERSPAESCLICSHHKYCKQAETVGPGLDVVDYIDRT